MKIYLVGIAGTAMGAFAGLLKQSGYEVLGSDTAAYPPMSDKLKEWGVAVKTPYAASNIEPDIDLVVIGNVASKTHVEVQEVQRLKLKFDSFPETLRKLFLGNRRSLVATGTHGKTTISAILAHTLMHAGKDPSFLIGGIPQNFSESFRLGQGPHFVIEGDEYDTAYFDKGPKFLHYEPHYLLCSSLEYDHADIYQNVDEIIERFAQVISLVPKDGVVVLNTKFPAMLKALEKADVKAQMIKYSEPENIQETPEGLEFQIAGKKVRIALSGRHNAQNALGCYLLLQTVGLTHDEIVQGFAAFKGVKRRMEVVAEKDGKIVIDDFAHHPTAVQATLEGACKRYPGRPVWALFEPRSASSCRKVFQNDYARSFGAAERVLLAPVGRNLDPAIALDTHELAQDIGPKAKACASLEELVEYVHQHAPDGAVLLCMSNGSFGGIHQKLLFKL